jgi:hypothetical protein
LRPEKAQSLDGLWSCLEVVVVQGKVLKAGAVLEQVPVKIGQPVVIQRQRV